MRKKEIDRESLAVKIKELQTTYTQKCKTNLNYIYQDLNDEFPGLKIPYWPFLDTYNKTKDPVEVAEMILNRIKIPKRNFKQPGRKKGGEWQLLIDVWTIITLPHEIFKRLNSNLNINQEV